MRRLSLAVALTALTAQPALASDDFAGAGPPVATLMAFGVLGGVFTTVVLTDALIDGERVHPALRNVGFAAGGVNIAAGAAGILAAALTDNDEYDGVIYGVGGGLLGLGLAGVALSWAATPYPLEHERPQPAAVQPVVGRGLVGAAWIGRF